MTIQNREPVHYAAGEMPLHRYCALHAQQTPERIALLWYGRTMCWRELDQLSTRLAVQLQRLGVVRGDRVALFLQNCPQAIIAHLATAKLGGIVVPCGPLSRQHELRDQLADCGAKILVAAADLMPIVEAARPGTSVVTVITTRYADLQPAQPACRKALAVPPELIAADASSAPPPRNTPGAAQLDLMQLMAEPVDVAERDAVAAIPVGLDDVALMVYTSGTTGRPKGAMLTHRNALYKTAVTVQVGGIQASDVMLAVAPLSHIAGMLMGMNTMLYSGAATILLYRFDPLAVLQAIDRYRVTWWYSMTPMNLAVMAHPDAAQYRMESLTTNPCTSFGVPLTEAIAEQWRAFAGPQCRTYEAAYGLSETHTCDAITPAHAPRWGWHGKIVPQTEVRIVDPHTGVELPPGQPGEITIRSPGVFRGYWQRDEATRAVLRNGFLHTGDIGQVSADGYLQWQGRIKEMIKVSGYSVFPEEVEALLSRHPGIRQVAVTPLPDPDKGEVVCAHVVPMNGVKLSEAELIAWSRENMAPYKVPRRVKFHDALPATATGKVLRRLLREEAIAA
ncbi:MULTISPECIES: AMP-binding protein [Ralstonia]|uniref:Long-chain-fatty-acid--CoA ligase n=1 Tax=Ralstonia mannitolilytica TaxID=105219 RepID=A0AAJ4ZIH5_9RALS|nr:MULTISPECIES: AMP-binding protein [Ralstonia]AJW43814.1 AMP-dependent synthetase [Ralstonia mannitolilytica]MBU9579853.1 AMP-binding protein [Ralstonia mannitolilytica]PLT16390.1 AMP-dependent synthetase [Ralstonia mannitolilytica]CAG2153381.1 Long-chain-fatty-acid--CoA ligase [Ralstonia mannitolilytica]CAJ0728502.1 Long-chain-fatty-acid--CoA ligase [Ralstonia mannitolilytica]